MWPNPQETADLVHLLMKFLMEKFIFCAVSSAQVPWVPKWPSALSVQVSECSSSWVP